MRRLFVTAIVASVMLVGCNQQEAAAPAAAPAPGTFSSTGTLTVVNNDTVMVDHGPIAELDWPAMDMTYIVPDPAMVHDLQAGTPVRFSFRQEGFGYVLTDIAKQ